VAGEGDGVEVAVVVAEWIERRPAGASGVDRPGETKLGGGVGLKGATYCMRRWSCPGGDAVHPPFR
jgi:hypothetical protein